MNGIRSFYQYPANSLNQSPIIQAIGALSASIIPVLTNSYTVGSLALAWVAGYFFSLFLLNGTNYVKLVVASLSGNWTYTFPDAGTNTNVILADITGEGSQSINSTLQCNNGLGVIGAINNSGAGASITSTGNIESNANLSGQGLYMSVYNNSSASGSHAIFQSTVGGASFGNPIFQAIVNAVQSYTWGIYNQISSQVWQLCYGASIGSNVGMQMTSTGVVSFPVQMNVGSSSPFTMMAPTSNSLSPVTYSTGTVSISGGVVTGSSTTFTSSMVGGLMVLANGVQCFITQFTSTTSLTVQDNTTQSSQNYIIYYGGVQNSMNIAGTAVWTGLNNLFVLGSINYPYSTVAASGATNPTYLNSGQTIGIPVLTAGATAQLPAVATSQGMKFKYVVTSGVTALGFTFQISTTDSHVLSGNFLMNSASTTVTFGTHSTLTFSASAAKNGDWLEFNCLNGKWLVSGSAFASAAIAVA
jgi:hypothetical protein